MKKVYILLLVMGFTSHVFSQCLHKAVYVNGYGQCISSPWVLVLDENFDQASLDKTRWAPSLGVLRETDLVVAKQWFKHENIEQVGGIGKLWIRKETITGTYVTSWEPYTTNTETFNYTSSELTSRFQYGYGKYEIRCKLPKGKGFWPSFWMFGGPGWNEIDVFEFKNKYSSGNFDATKSVKEQESNLHYDYDSDGESENCSVKHVGVDYSLDYHTFTVVWDNYKMEWYVDGQLKRRETKFSTISEQQIDCNGLVPASYKLNTAYPQQQYMNIIAGTGIQNRGGEEGEVYEGPDAFTPFPSSLDIDYIRYYRQISCLGALNVNNVNQLYLQYNSDNLNTPYNIKLGSTINVSGNITIENKQQVELRAQSAVVLSPGFWAKPGSDFIAHTDPAMSCSKSYLGNESVDEPEVQPYLGPPSLYGGIQSPPFSVYPNPSSDGIYHIDVSEARHGPLTVSVKDFFGREVKTETGGRALRIDISGHAKGIYYILVSDGDKIFGQKVIYE